MADITEPTTDAEAEVEAHSEAAASETEVFEESTELVCGIYDPATR
ncbi:hypothetical protein [Streptomyces sp. NPDC006739]